MSQQQQQPGAAALAAAQVDVGRAMMMTEFIRQIQGACEGKCLAPNPANERLSSAESNCMQLCVARYLEVQSIVVSQLSAKREI
jgi:hypothetical protein